MNIKRAGWLVCTAMVLVMCSGPVRAQGTASSPATAPASASLTNDILMQWSRAGMVLEGMAKDFPEDKLEYRPKPEVRTFAEQILHATVASKMFADMAAGIMPKSFDEVEKPSRENLKTREQIVALIQKTFADGADAIKKYGDKGLLESVDSPFEKGKKVTRAWMFTFATAHVYDHYGQCVVYYRLNELVPPESRHPM
jgi:DinB superfamily